MAGVIIDHLIKQTEYRLFRTAYAERKAPLVIIGGAGLSAPADLPNWVALRKKLQQEADGKLNYATQIGGGLLGPRLEAARKQSDIWVAFKLLKDILTQPVFEGLIDQYLSVKPSTQTPPSYAKLFQLNPRGFLTLNLDTFAGDAFASAHPGRMTIPIYGREIINKWNIINSAQGYLVYLHGGLHDPATWVLTQDDLSELLTSDGHKLLLQSLFLTNIVLFVGISADDIAMSKRLMELRHVGARPSNLYWLTTRHDEHIEKWAADSYVKIVRYEAHNDRDHEDAITAFVSDCTSYLSYDMREPPLIDTGLTSISSDAECIDAKPEELAFEQPELIRNTISAMLQGRLKRAGEEKIYEEYRNFCDEFHYPVHMSFYKSHVDRFRKWFGYLLDFPALGRGNFGEVFSAQSPEGKSVAVKIMHESIFENDDMLGGFRRGVKSMKIVTTQKVEGMVPVIEYYELPPTIIMPFVEGVSLEQVLGHRPTLEWVTKLTIGRRVGEIVSAGHALPQTILHRDIKPSNIMIQNFEYSGSFDPNVVVLDFDMSWHKGSTERDVVFESRDDFGYLAPEQTDRNSRYTARSTRVDCYGFGMTLFYMFGLEAPRPNEALSDRWPELALRATRNGYNENWKSAPERLARLITRCTSIDQNDRIDFATVVRELKFLAQAVLDSGELDNTDLWAEEIIAGIDCGGKYEWDDSLGKGHRQTAEGVVIEVSSNIKDRYVSLYIKYIDTGMRERGGLNKYIAASKDSASSLLAAAGWSVNSKRSGYGEVAVSVKCSIDVAAKQKEHIINSANNAMRLFIKL